MTLLSVRGLTAGYGRVQALHGVDLDVPAGAVVAVLGPNGAGKTTLLRAISGTLAPWSGSVLFDGVDRTGTPDHQMARAGVCHIPEGRSVFPSLSVDRNLELAALVAGSGRTTDRAALHEMFPVLAERRDQKAGSLSGGEQQMLALSRALLTKPKLLLLDELSLGLAPKVVHALFERVEALHRAGAAVLLVEQYVRQALRLADFVAVLARGRVQFFGEPGELRHSTDILEAYLGKAAVG